MFSEKQVISLIKSSVESGEIEVGTKWYLHYALFKDSNDDQIGFRFLSPYNDDITSYEELSDYLSDNATILLDGRDNDDTGTLPNCFKILQVIPGEFRCYYVFDTSPFVAYVDIVFDEMVNDIINPL